MVPEHVAVDICYEWCITECIGWMMCWYCVDDLLTRNVVSPSSPPCHQKQLVCSFLASSHKLHVRLFYF